MSGVICRAEKQLFHLSYQGFYAMITMIFDRFSWESLFFAPVLKQVINFVMNVWKEEAACPRRGSIYRESVRCISIEGRKQEFY